MLTVRADRLTRILGSPQGILGESSRLQRIFVVGEEYSPRRFGISRVLRDLKSQICESCSPKSLEEREVICLDDQGKSLFRRYKDISSFFPICPIRKTRAGQNGTTLLVAYSRGIKLEDLVAGNISPPISIKYVFKFSDSEREVPCGEIYRFFLNGVDFFGFDAPLASVLDLNRRTYQSSDRGRHSLSEKDATIIYNNFAKAVKLLGIEIPTQQNLIIFLERIMGENFFDFVSSKKYEELTDNQKNKFFQRLGRLILLDLILGNMDRFIREYSYDCESDTYRLEDLESNVGNLMLVLPKSGDNTCLSLYVIDNEIKPKFISDIETKARHLDFLMKFFKKPEFEKEISKVVVIAIKKGLDGTAEDVLTKAETIQQLQSKYALFVNDLERESTAQFISLGVLEMSHALRQTLIPRWKGAEGISLRTYLKDNFKELESSIYERLEIFEKTRGQICQ